MHPVSSSTNESKTGTDMRWSTIAIGVAVVPMFSAQPVHAAFDVHGQLWVAETRNYPQASPTNSIAADLVRVLSDFGPDGKARSNRVFADDFSMPDAVAPYWEGVVVFSIPNIAFLRETDGDGVCDWREVLYGPFGARDHHNLIAYLLGQRQGPLKK